MYVKKIAQNSSKPGKDFSLKRRYETYLIPGETLIPGGRGEAFHPGIGYASYLNKRFIIHISWNPAPS